MPAEQRRISGIRSLRDPAVDLEPGARLSDFDRETQAFGLSTTTGINSTTGMAGLTLGGGFGWQSRKRGSDPRSWPGSSSTHSGRRTRYSRAIAVSSPARQRT